MRIVAAALAGLAVLGTAVTASAPASSDPCARVYSTPVLIDIDGTVKEATVGPPDSCGTGYRCVRVQN